MNSVNRVRNKEISGFSPKQCDIPQSLHKNTRGEIFFRFDSEIQDQSRFLFSFQIYNKKFLNHKRYGLFTQLLKVFQATSLNL